MASETISEIDRIQNPALAALLIWQFGFAFKKESANRPCSILLAFLVLPLTLHKTTREKALKTQSSSGLALFAAKLAERKDDLLAIHTRSLALRELTLTALTLAIRTEIISVDYRTAEIRINDTRLPEIPERVRPLFKASDRFGVWFARSSLSEVSTLLHVSY